tara:strand:+ start:266052 stop:266465 length:414 start_codon:yes stop_codon:yes gene_type:complete
MKNLTITLAIFSFLFISCNQNAPKEEKKAQVSLAISGMTCEIGCAKTIESKLSKKEGVLDAKVIFKDSIANIEFDANKTSKKDLIAFVDGIAGGDLYKAKESDKKAHACTEECKKECMLAEKKECKEDCKMPCCKKA